MPNTTEELAEIHIRKVKELEQKIISLNEWKDAFYHEDGSITYLNKQVNLMIQKNILQDVAFSELKEGTNIWIQNYNNDLKELKEQIKQLREWMDLPCRCENVLKWLGMKVYEFIGAEHFGSYKQFEMKFEGEKVHRSDVHMESSNAVEGSSPFPMTSIKGDDSKPSCTSCNYYDGKENLNSLNICNQCYNYKHFAPRKKPLDNFTKALSPHLSQEQLKKPSESDRTKDLLDNMERMEQTKTESLESHREYETTANIIKIIEIYDNGHENIFHPDTYTIVEKDDLDKLCFEDRIWMKKKYLLE